MNSAEKKRKKEEKKQQLNLLVLAVEVISMEAARYGGPYPRRSHVGRARRRKTP